jgi:hypothetical protein
MPPDPRAFNPALPVGVAQVILSLNPAARPVGVPLSVVGGRYGTTAQ